MFLIYLSLLNMHERILPSKKKWAVILRWYTIWVKGWAEWTFLQMHLDIRVSHNLFFSAPYQRSCHGWGSFSMANSCSYPLATVWKHLPYDEFARKKFSFELTSWLTLLCLDGPEIINLHKLQGTLTCILSLMTIE